MFLGSSTGRRSEDLPQPNQKTSGFSELTVSAIGYNTVSHGGLKSYRRLLVEKGDKETSLLQTSDDETVRLQPMQNTTSSSPDGKLVASASVDRTDLMVCTVFKGPLSIRLCFVAQAADTLLWLAFQPDIFACLCIWHVIRVLVFMC